MRRLLLASVLVGVALAVAVSANGQSVDRVSTKRFIAETTTFLKVAVAEHGHSVAAVNSLIRHVTSTCPAALATDPRNGTAAQQRTRNSFFAEAAFEFVLAEVAPIRAALAAYTGELKRLHWSRSALNRTVATEVRLTIATLALRPPDLCSDATAAAARHFVATPPDAARFIKAANSALPDSPPTLADELKLMKAFIARSDQASIKRLNDLQLRLNHLIGSIGLDAFSRMTKALFGS